MEKDKISVIVPIYNIMDCLEKCVMSIINQTYKDLEIICVVGNTDENAIYGTKDFNSKSGFFNGHRSRKFR